MLREYQIEGMSCGNCVKKVEQALSQIPEIISADVQIGKALINSKEAIKVSRLQQQLGKYKISEVFEESVEINAETKTGLTTYYPLILTVLFIVLVCTLAQYPLESFSLSIWMRHFMAGFFIAFSFFKLLDIKGFASSFRMYDIVATRWNGWGYVYPFVELGLGLLFLTGVWPVFALWATIILLGVGTIGVIEANLNRRKIKCACLGTVFNLPMSTVTIVENVSMILMAVIMLVR